MLILQRKEGESLCIGNDIEVTVVAVEGGRVRLAIKAPSEMIIVRSELSVEAAKTNRDAACDKTIPEDLVSFIKKIKE